MDTNSGRVLTEQALVSDQAASRLDPSGFDPSRGIRMTVGYIFRDAEALDEFMVEQGRKHHYRDPKADVRSFAWSMGDMFAEQQAIDAALDSDMDGDEIRRFVRDVPCNPDLDAHLKEWGLDSDSD